MEDLIVISDTVLVEMMTYERTLAQIQTLTRVMSGSASPSGADNQDILHMRISVYRGVLAMYDSYRLKKWTQIMDLSDEFTRVAERNGNSSTRLTLTEEYIGHQLTQEKDETFTYWMEKNDSPTRLD